MGGPICNVNIVELRKEICSMKRYGYHRTSTREQHLDRGIAEIETFCKNNNIELEKIYTDQQTGKNFDRPRYTGQRANDRTVSVLASAFGS